METIAQLCSDLIPVVERAFAAFGFALVKTNKRREALSFEQIREVNHERWRDLLYFNPLAVQGAPTETVKGSAAPIVANPAATIPEPRGVHNSFYEWFSSMSSEDRIKWWKFKKQFARHIVELRDAGTSDEAMYYRKRFLHLWGHELEEELPVAPKDDDSDAKNIFLTKLCARNLLIHVELMAAECQIAGDALSWCTKAAQQRLIANRSQTKKEYKTKILEWKLSNVIVWRRADRYLARTGKFHREADRHFSQVDTLRVRHAKRPLKYEEASNEATYRERNARSLYAKVQALAVELLLGPPVRKWSKQNSSLRKGRAQKDENAKAKREAFIRRFCFPVEADLRAKAKEEDKPGPKKTQIIREALERARNEARREYDKTVRDLESRRIGKESPAHEVALELYNEQIDLPSFSTISEHFNDIRPLPLLS